MRMLFDLVKQNIITSIDRLHLYNKKNRDKLMQQHKALYKAIMQGKAEQAKQAANKHIAYVCDVLE